MTLVHYGYRDYDPEMGRWTAKDPYGFTSENTDLYGYCLNNPLIYSDPTGEILPGAVVVAAAFATLIAYTVEIIVEAYVASKEDRHMEEREEQLVPPEPEDPYGTRRRVRGPGARPCK